MAEDPKLTAEPRPKLGSAESRRLRRSQRIPGNVYGHGEPPVTISVPEDVLTPIVFSGHKVVDLQLEGNTQKAMVREVQWDTFGMHLVHVDLQRVSAGERVVTEITVETHGTAPGVLAGGTLEMALHTIRVECPALQIPDQIEININQLEMDQAVHVRDLELPPNVTALNDEDEVVLHVVQRAVPEVEEEEVPEAVEPELVSKPEEEEEPTE